MKLYEITIKHGVETPDYDVYLKFWITAENEIRARLLAQKMGGRETVLKEEKVVSKEEKVAFWTDVSKTDCIEFVSKEEKVVASSSYFT